MAKSTDKTTTNTNANKYSAFPFATRHNAIDEDYEISKEALGCGVNGRILKCQHRRTGQKCALKILKDSPKARQEVILHKIACDLKEDNLLLTNDRNDAILKLCDFGFAKKGDNQLLFTTPLFPACHVAPEILAREKYDKACDIWSMGVIMYILLCGYPPFYPESEQQLSPHIKTKTRAGRYEFPDAEWRNISNEAKSIIRRMLTVDPTSRITIGEILTSPWLTELTSERPIDMTVLQDAETRQQLQAAVASATDTQRLTDDDLGIKISAPGKSRIDKRAAKKKEQMPPTGDTSFT
ncbi:unnamed protein product [Rotaria sp. Silwood1]|nr:unnamed protein product [Rotaria sp. Silwood1]